MWDDGFALQGRQTKRKLTWLLLLAAACTVGLGLMLQNPTSIIKTLYGLQMRSPWHRESTVTLPVGQYAALGDGFVAVGEAEIIVLDRGGETVYTIPAALEEPILLSEGDFCAVYSPGGDRLYLLEQETYHEISVPLGLDTAALGRDGSITIVTRTPGRLSRVLRYDKGGALTETLDFPDSMVAMTAMLRDGTLALTAVDRDGIWCLRLDSGTIPLEAAVVYDLLPCGKGVVLWTDTGLLFYDGAGSLLGRIDLAPDTVEALAAGDCAALLVRSLGELRLVTVSPDGTLHRSAPLEAPKALTVMGDRVCLLDSGSFQVYDNACILRQRQRSCAGDLIQTRGGVLLVDGCRITHPIINE